MRSKLRHWHMRCGYIEISIRPGIFHGRIFHTRKHEIYFLFITCDLYTKQAPRCLEIYPFGENIHWSSFRCYFFQHDAEVWWYVCCWLYILINRGTIDLATHVQFRISTPHDIFVEDPLYISTLLGIVLTKYGIYIYIYTYICYITKLYKIIYEIYHTCLTW